MPPRLSKNRTPRVIRIDDYSIVISLAITALMVVVAVSFVGRYPLAKGPGIEYVSRFSSELIRAIPVRNSVLEKTPPPSVGQTVPSPPPERKQTVPPAAPPVSVAFDATRGVFLPGTVSKKAAAPAVTPAEPSASDLNRLTTIRGGRHQRHASIVFQFSRPAVFSRPRVEQAEIRFRLDDTVTGLRPYRKYKTFDSWVRLQPVNGNIAVRVGVPKDFYQLKAFSMQDPHRLVVNLYDQDPVRSAALRQAFGETAPGDEKGQATIPGRGEGTNTRLTTIRAGRHERYASIVFEFNHPVDFSAPVIENGLIHFRLKDILTGLRPYRRYRTFNSWVRLEEKAGGLDVYVRVPDNFKRLSAFLMKIPDRLVVNLYDR